MSRIASCFEAAKAANRKLLIPYITAGDPDLDATLLLMTTMVERGADIVELGVPFSDPMADGPVIQAACERALKVGTTLDQIIDLVSRFRETDKTTPLVLMGYMNPIETMGHTSFTEKASAAGVDGVLIVDLPPEEGTELVNTLRARQIDSIFLLSPNTPDYRVKSVCEAVSGYVYYVSLKGVTGAGTLDTDEVASKVTNIKSLSSVPVAVGFGISDADSAARVASVSDAVVVGSALVNIVGECGADHAAANERVGDLLGSMRKAIDNV